MENDPANSTALEQAIKEATDDATFQKVKRMSYSGNAAGEVSFQHINKSIACTLHIAKCTYSFILVKFLGSTHLNLLFIFEFIKVNNIRYSNSTTVRRKRTHIIGKDEENFFRQS